MPLLERLGDVLRGLPPDRAGQEQRLAVLPLVGLLVEGARRRRDPEVGHGRTRGGEAQLRVVDEVADDGDDGLACHVRSPSLIRWMCRRDPSLPQAPTVGRCVVHRRTLSAASGRRTLVRRIGLVERELAVELLDRGRLGGQVDDGVDALGVLLDLVGEPATAPDVDVLDGAAVLADDVEVLVERRLDGALFETRVEDDHDFIGTQSGLHLLWTRRPRSLRGRRALRSPSGCRSAADGVPCCPFPVGGEAQARTAQISSGARRTPKRGPAGQVQTARVEPEVIEVDPAGAQD